MGRLYIPAQNEISGPWMMSYDNLRTLDILFSEIDKKLKEALNKTIENTAKQQMEEDSQQLDLPKRIAKLQRKYSQKSKSAEVTFSDDSTYKAEDIEGIINYVDTHPTFAPKELYIRTIHGNSENDFDLIINSNSSEQEVEFEYRIKCIDEEIQQKIKTLIDQWIRENKPNKLLQIWSPIVAYIILFIAGFTALISGLNINDTSPDYKAEFKKESKKIIEKGITAANRDSAIILLLKMKSEYIPDDKNQTYNKPNITARRTFIVSSIAFIISIIIPRTIIGIGKKHFWYRVYKIWIWLISGMLLFLISSLYERFWSLFG